MFKVSLQLKGSEGFRSPAYFHRVPCDQRPSGFHFTTCVRDPRSSRFHRVRASSVAFLKKTVTQIRSASPIPLPRNPAIRNQESIVDTFPACEPSHPSRESSTPRAPSTNTKQGSPLKWPSPQSNLARSPEARSTLVNPDTLPHGSTSTRGTRAASCAPACCS